MKKLKTGKVLNAKRLMVALAMTACLTGHAFAAAPKAETTVMGDRVTLGDVFDGVKDHADFYLAPAPAVGKTMVLNAGDLTRISETFHLGWTADSNLSQVVIHRSSNMIDHGDIQAALQAR